MASYQERIAAAIDQLDTNGWAVGPTVEAERWRERVRAEARNRGWRIVTGTSPAGAAWAARTDLEDERETPWYRLGFRPQTFFENYRI